MKDMKSTVDVVKSLEAGTFTATANGTSADLQGYEGALFVYDVGVFGGTSPTATLRFEESDDDSVFTTIPAADLEGVQPVQITGVLDQLTARVGYKGAKRYIRQAISAMAGTSPSLVMSGSIVRGVARHNPLA